MGFTFFWNPGICWSLRLTESVDRIISAYD